jgi:hypothetical protein
MDALTSYDEKTGNYYMWLVQRGLYNDHLNIDLSALNIHAGSPVTVETVSPDKYGEANELLSIKGNKSISFTLPAQSVILLTIPSQNLRNSVLTPVADATVYGGKYKDKNDGKSKQLTVALDASKPENNAVSFIRFDLSGHKLAAAKRVLLKVNGYNATDDSVFRFHVYGMPASNWNQQTLTWSNSPQLDTKEALITQVGQRAYVAGELAMNHHQQNHYLDVTRLVKDHAGRSITFALVRETRQMGDDADKGKKVIINSAESQYKPELQIWSAK